MEVDTDSIIAFMSFLVGSYIFMARNIKFEMPNREEFLERLKKDKDVENEKKRKEAETKAEDLMGKLFGMKKDIETDKADMAKLDKERKEKEKELEELQKKKAEKEKKEKEEKDKEGKDKKRTDITIVLIFLSHMITQFHLHPCTHPPTPITN